MRRCFDWDDYEDANHDWTVARLEELRALNPAFRCTLFGITAKCSRLHELPDWVEVAAHGWRHPTPMECSDWSYMQTANLLNRAKRDGFVEGFKAPGWQISDGSYLALVDKGWWLADQEYNRGRRPLGLRVYEIGPDDWHGHVSDVCGNGLEETWGHVEELVADTEVFQLVSERAA